MRTINKPKYKKLFSILLGSNGYLGPKVGPINSSLHFYLIGKRGENSFYDLNKSVVGIKQLFDFLENVVVDRGRILLIGGSISLVSLLLCLSLSKDSHLKVIPWNFSSISNSTNQDFMIVHEIDKKAILESYNQLSPLGCVGYPDVRGIAYPINLNLDKTELSNWYCWGLISSYRRGYYRRFRFYYEV